MTRRRLIAARRLEQKKTGATRAQIGKLLNAAIIAKHDDADDLRSLRFARAIAYDDDDDDEKENACDRASKRQTNKNVYKRASRLFSPHFYIADDQSIEREKRGRRYSSYSKRKF